ncbi:hypothetical protein ACFLTA_05230 [Bacteroidota bacterium]
MRTVILFILFQTFVSVISAQTRQRLYPVSIDDSTFSVDLPELHVRVIYPKLERREPMLAQRFGDSLSIYTLFLGIKDDLTLQVEFATRDAVTALSERFKLDDGSGDYIPQTEEQFLHRKQIFQEHIVFDYFKSYRRFHDRRYGTIYYCQEIAGFVNEAYTYIDDFQVIVRSSGHTDDLPKQVRRFLLKDLSTQSNNRTDYLTQEIVLYVLEQRFLALLSRVRFEKI